jgi:hypothetical protein
MIPKYRHLHDYPMSRRSLSTIYGPVSIITILLGSGAHVLQYVCVQTERGILAIINVSR